MAKSEQKQTTPAPRFLAGNRTIILQPIPRALLADVMSELDKPAAYKREVSYMDGAVVREEEVTNPELLSDEERAAYEERQAEINLWNVSYVARLLRTCVAYGVKKVDGPGPTKREIELLLETYGTISEDALRRKWVLLLIGDRSQEFIDLVMGQTEITPEGLAVAEDSFRADSEGAGVHGESDRVSA